MYVSIYSNIYSCLHMTWIFCFWCVLQCGMCVCVYLCVCLFLLPCLALTVCLFVDRLIFRLAARPVDIYIYAVHSSHSRVNLALSLPLSLVLAQEKRERKENKVIKKEFPNQRIRWFRLVFSSAISSSDAQYFYSFSGFWFRCSCFWSIQWICWLQHFQTHHSPYSLSLSLIKPCQHFILIIVMEIVSHSKSV